MLCIVPVAVLTGAAYMNLSEQSGQGEQFEQSKQSGPSAAQGSSVLQVAGDEMHVETRESADKSLDTVTAPMSKNQQKRLLREERHKETKDAWRKLQKTKRKMKMQAKRIEREAKGTESLPRF